VREPVEEVLNDLTLRWCKPKDGERYSCRARAIAVANKRALLAAADDSGAAASDPRAKRKLDVDEGESRAHAEQRAGGGGEGGSAEEDESDEDEEEELVLRRPPARRRPPVAAAAAAAQQFSDVDDFDTDDTDSDGRT